MTDVDSFAASRDAKMFQGRPALREEKNGGVGRGGGGKLGRGAASPS